MINLVRDKMGKLKVVGGFAVSVRIRVWGLNDGEKIGKMRA